MTFFKCQPDQKSCTSDLSFKMELLVVGSSRACHPVEAEGTVAGGDPEVEQKAPGFPPAFVPLVADQSALPGGSTATWGRCPVSFALVPR